MWTIEKDFEEARDLNWADGENHLDVYKKVCVQSVDHKDELDSTLTERFRLYDDDGNLYYEGRSDDSSSFDPLDDYGMPNAGAVDIRYLENGKWETL